MRPSPRFVFAFLLLVSLASLAAALILGEVFRLRPCYLCNFQRLLYMVMVFFALGGVLLPDWNKLWSFLFGAVAMGGIAAAGQQSWMQYAPQQSIECGLGDPTLIERLVDWLGAQWPAMFMVTGFCSDKDGVLFGLSLANWSVVCFLLLFLAAVWLFFQRGTRPR